MKFAGGASRVAFHAVGAGLALIVCMGCRPSQPPADQNLEDAKNQILIEGLLRSVAGAPEDVIALVAVKHGVSIDAVEKLRIEDSSIGDQRFLVMGATNLAELNEHALMLSSSNIAQRIRSLAGELQIPPERAAAILVDLRVLRAAREQHQPR